MFVCIGMVDVAKLGPGPEPASEAIIRVDCRRRTPARPGPGRTSLFCQKFILTKEYIHAKPRRPGGHRRRQPQAWLYWA